MAPHTASASARSKAASPASRWTIQEIRPEELREELIDFFWSQRHWPYPTREDYARAWDWRQASLGVESARVWIARAEDTGEILGHIAVYPRRFRFRGRELRVAVPGNFLVREDQRNTLIGPRLATGLRRLVIDREYDVVLAYANPAAHQMFTRLGFRVLGQFHEFLDVRRSASILRRYGKGAVIAAPIVDAAMAIRRRWLQRHSGRDVMDWEARLLDSAAVRQLDRAHWAVIEDRLAPACLGQFIAGRFLDAPFTDYQVVGIYDNSGRVQALVVVNPRRRVRVVECAVNPLAIDSATAISVALRALPEPHAVLVQTLPSSQLAGELERAGYIAREPLDPVAARTWWSAFWRDDHPLATELAHSSRWALLFGSTHY